VAIVVSMPTLHNGHVCPLTINERYIRHSTGIITAHADHANAITLPASVQYATPAVDAASQQKSSYTSAYVSIKIHILLYLCAITNSPSPFATKIIFVHCNIFVLTKNAVWL
jgi:hypothetical protein